MDEKKLTDEETVKALELYSEKCPLQGCDGFATILGSSSIDLIHRLQAENEQLKKDRHDMSWIIKIHKYCVGADHCQNSSTREFELQKQVDKLKEENGKLVTIGNG